MGQGCVRGQSVDMFNFAGHTACLSFSALLLQPKSSHRHISRRVWLCSNKT